MANFDDLTEAQQTKILTIADAEIAKDKIRTEYKDLVQENINKEFKTFFSRKDKFDQSQVPTSQLQYDKDKVTRFQNNSGQFIERAMITFDNGYQMSITRPKQEYGSNPNEFNISPRKPNGEIDITLIDDTLPNQNIIYSQTVSDINTHIAALGNIVPNEKAKNSESEKDDS